MSTGIDERVDEEVKNSDPLADSDIVHFTCCRRWGVKAICGIDLTGHDMEEEKDADCVVCVDLTKHEIKVMALTGRDHAHCPIDKVCCPPVGPEKA